MRLTVWEGFLLLLDCPLCPGHPVPVWNFLLDSISVSFRRFQSLPVPVEPWEVVRFFSSGQFGELTCNCSRAERFGLIWAVATIVRRRGDRFLNDLT